MWPLFFNELLLNSYDDLISVEFDFQKGTHLQLTSEEKRMETLCGHYFLHLICVQLYTVPHLTHYVLPAPQASQHPPGDFLGSSSVFVHLFGSKLAWICMGAVKISLSRSWSVNASAALAFRILGSLVVPS